MQRFIVLKSAGKCYQVENLSNRLSNNSSFSIIQNEDELDQPRSMHITNLESVFRSKYELWKLMSADGEAYLPPYSNASSYNFKH